MSSLIQQRRALLEQSGNLLPSGYTKYDWVQADRTTGTPSIQTGISLIGNRNTASKRYTFAGMFARVSGAFTTNNCILGNGVSNYSTIYNLRNSASYNTILRFNYEDRGGGTANNTISIDIGEWHNFTLTHKDDDQLGGKLILDDVVYLGKTETNNATTAELRLLGVDGADTYPCRLAELKVYEYDTLIADFIPAKRDADDVVGFYDVVRSTFYEPSIEGVTLLCGNGFDNFNS